MKIVNWKCQYLVKTTLLSVIKLTVLKSVITQESSQMLESQSSRHDDGDISTSSKYILNEKEYINRKSVGEEINSTCEKSNVIKTGKARRNYSKRPKRPQVTSTVHPRLNITPKLMIFEPDRVLWPFDYETEVVLPYDLIHPDGSFKTKKSSRWKTGNFGGRVLIDDTGKCLLLNYDALLLFLKLQHKGIKLAVASTVTNNSRTTGMKHLIRLFEFEDLLLFIEIGTKSPVDHVKEIKQQSGLEFRDIIYFGTNQSILQQIKSHLNVITVHVDPELGLDVNDVQEGARLYAIRPHVPEPFETPLRTGKIISNEDECNAYEDEVMHIKRDENDSSASIESEFFNTSSEIPDIDFNLTKYNIFYE